MVCVILYALYIDEHLRDVMKLLLSTICKPPEKWLCVMSYLLTLSIFLVRYEIVSFFAFGSEINEWFSFGMSNFEITVILPTDPLLNQSYNIWILWIIIHIDNIIDIRSTENWIP